MVHAPQWLRVGLSPPLPTSEAGLLEQLWPGSYRQLRTHRVYPSPRPVGAYLARLGASGLRVLLAEGRESLSRACSARTRLMYSVSMETDSSPAL